MTEPREGKPKAIACPGCGAGTIWHDSNPYRPFCSERCKLIDFGQWASESYRMPSSRGTGDFQADEDGQT